MAKYAIVGICNSRGDGYLLISLSPTRESLRIYPNCSPMSTAIVMTIKNSEARRLRIRKILSKLHTMIRPVLSIVCTQYIVDVPGVAQ
jgi:hypothetical protein